MTYPLFVLSKVVFFGGALHNIDNGQLVAHVADVLGHLVVVAVFVGIHHRLGFQLVNQFLGTHIHLLGELYQSHDLFALQLLGLHHIFTLHPAELDEIEVGEMENEANKDEHTGPHH